MLYLVATPIGHLDDITLRALEILRGVDIVLSEDTRRTGRLLKHYGISARQMAYHEHNEQRAVPRALAVLEQGRDLALVTDAGTPGIADPGYRLVQAAIQAEIPVSMAPGPSAPIMARFIIERVLASIVSSLQPKPQHHSVIASWKGRVKASAAVRFFST